MSIAHAGHMLDRPAAGHPQPKTSAVAEFPCHGLSVQRIVVVAGASLACLLINKAGTPGNLAFFLICGVMFTLRPAAAVAAATLSMIALCANTAFVPKTVAWTFGRFATLFGFAGRFALAGADSRWVTSPPYVALTLFCLVAGFCSIASGYYVHIAILKLVSFWVGMTGIMACIHTVRCTRTDTTEWYVAQAGCVCLMCALSLAMGVAANFRGIAIEKGLYNLGFYHSQTMGPVAAMLIVYVLCVYLFAGHRNRWVCLPIAGALLVFLWMTRSRTGMGTLVAGLCVALVATFTWRVKRQMRLRLNVSRSTLVVLFVAAAMVFAAADVVSRGQISQKVLGFVAKKSQAVESVTLDETLASRRGLVERSYENFRESPIFGIGFQVAKTQYFVDNATLFTAPVEKGFLPTAVLEEVGLVGATSFVIFLITMFRQLISERNIPGLTMFTTFLIMNLGEVTIFGLAGPGAYQWMLVAGGIMLGDRCTLPQHHFGRFRATRGAHGVHRAS